MSLEALQNQTVKTKRLPGVVETGKAFYDAIPL